MNSSRQSLLILGSTGSIGVNTLDVVSRHPDKFKVTGLVAGQNIELLKEQAEQFQPSSILICDEASRTRWFDLNYSEQIQKKTGHRVEVLGSRDLTALAAGSDSDTVMAAIVGAAGLEPALSAIESGKTVYLANKESLVLGGQFMLDACKRSSAKLLPVDSEHNAIYQCLPSTFAAGTHESHGIHRLVLTASGGPFRSRELNTLEAVTPDEAVAHPNWSMGRKISVDSATMANKGLELIEALWLFGIPYERLSVLIHPQSIVHSMVEYIDGSVIAQMGCPDMRTPIAHVLGFPDRIASGSPRLDLASVAQLSFEEPDFRRFPMLKLAFDVLKQVEVAAPVYNAANEVAVEGFLSGRMKYLEIYKTVEACLDRFCSEKINCLEDAFELDRQVRVYATETISKAH